MCKLNVLPIQTHAMCICLKQTAHVLFCNAEPFSAAGKLVGDALLAAAFVSYAGPFNMEFRKRLVTEKWLPDLTERQIPLTPGFMPLDMLADESSKVSFTCQTCCLLCSNLAFSVYACRANMCLCIAC